MPYIHDAQFQVPRHIKIIAPDTPYFAVRRDVVPGRDESSKIAAGMEVAFTVIFRPESTEHYAYNLIVCSEREKFVVPILAAGAAPALDLPDLVEFGSAPVWTEAKQTVLVRNIGSQASAFSLLAQAPFSAVPSQGFLAPGETLQLQVRFLPDHPGRFQGELEVRFEGDMGGMGSSVFSQLMGHGHELDVALSQELVSLLPTYVTKMSQRTFKVVNRSDIAINFAVKANPGRGVDRQHTGQQLEELGATQATLMLSQGGRPFDEQGNGEESEDEDAILADGESAVRRQFKPLRRAAALDARLFGTKNFQVVPSEGVVWPGSEVEVTVQFLPDYTKEYEEVAFVEVQVRPMDCAVWSDAYSKTLKNAQK